jgi:hypothetical protein
MSVSDDGPMSHALEEAIAKRLLAQEVLQKAQQELGPPRDTDEYMQKISAVIAAEKALEEASQELANLFEAALFPI